MPLAFATLSLVAGDAAADDLAACNGALVRGQELVRAGKLLEARAAYPGCLRAECNAELRAVCANFVAELTQRVPTLRLVARSRSGAALSGVRFFVDDKPASGDAVEVDPGAHRVRAVAAGHDTAGVTIDARVGEGTREVVLDLAPNASAPDPPAHAAAGSTKIPVASVVLGGVALAGLGSFAYFGLDGKSTEKNLRATCPTGPCDSSDMRRSYLVADVSLGVAVASAAAAVILFVTSQPPQSALRQPADGRRARLR
ncbi:MAG: hypothetical protein U0235_13040 [Polyangiaceae bacterium]